MQGAWLLSSALCLLTLCPMPSALCSMPHALCPVLHVYPVKFACGDYFTGAYALCPRIPTCGFFCNIQVHDSHMICFFVRK